MDIIIEEQEIYKKKPYLLCPFYNEIKDDDFVFIDGCIKYNKHNKFSARHPGNPYDTSLFPTEYTFKIDNKHKDNIRTNTNVLIKTDNNKWAYLKCTNIIDLLLYTVFNFENNANDVIDLKAEIIMTSEDLGENYKSKEWKTTSKSYRDGIFFDSTPIDNYPSYTDRLTSIPSTHHELRLDEGSFVVSPSDQNARLTVGDIIVTQQGQQIGRLQSVNYDDNTLLIDSRSEYRTR